MKVKKICKLLLFSALLLCLAFVTAPRQQIKVACVGDSITYGSGIKDREQNSYPAQVQQILGKGWEVKNFGVSGATMLKKGDKPYCQQEDWQQSLDFAPDLVVIKLGTNDSKPQNWKYREEYIANYREMISTYRNLPSRPQVMVCLPAPVFETRWGISGEVVDNEIIPALKQMAKAEKVKIINLYKPLSGHPEWFPDKIHPDKNGAAEMARVVAKHINNAAKRLK